MDLSVFTMTFIPFVFPGDAFWKTRIWSKFSSRNTYISRICVRIRFSLFSVVFPDARKKLTETQVKTVKNLPYNDTSAKSILITRIFSSYINKTYYSYTHYKRFKTIDEFRAKNNILNITCLLKLCLIIYKIIDFMF